jgi:hypothetical protein
MFLAVSLILLLLRTRMESAIIKDKTLFHDYDIRHNFDGCRDISRNCDGCHDICRIFDGCRSRGIPTFNATSTWLLIIAHGHLDI